MVDEYYGRDFLKKLIWLVNILKNIFGRGLLNNGNFRRDFLVMNIFEDTFNNFWNFIHMFLLIKIYVWNISWFSNLE